MKRLLIGICIGVFVGAIVGAAFELGILEFSRPSLWVPQGGDVVGFDKPTNPEKEFTVMVWAYPAQIGDVYLTIVAEARSATLTSYDHYRYTIKAPDAGRAYCQIFDRDLLTPSQIEARISDTSNNVWKSCFDGLIGHN